MPFLNIPHIPQKAEADCLVACAAMMLAAVNIEVDYERLQMQLGYQSGGLPYRRLQWLARLHSHITITLQQGNLSGLEAAIDVGMPPAVFVFTGELPY